ncbi:HlyD family secretion protein [Panacagrimonas perspica]|nr:HlyD family efflux transporter periplasmic adaptor subunit [Panacagrimonas perspica]
MALLALALAGCDKTADSSITGYVEALYLRPAPASGGRMTSLAVDRGATVKAGQPLFALDADREQAAVAEAQARIEAQSARVADLDKGGRPEELAVIRAQLQQAEAQLKLSTATAKRQASLAAQKLVSAEALDTANTTQARDSAHVAELKRQLDVAELTGRSDAIEAARQDVAAAQAQLAQAQWALAQKSVAAPADGSIEDVYFRAGEWVNAGQPVLALLPPANRRLRFFVPQQRLAEFAQGRSVHARCDGCGEAIAATVNFVAAQAEFAPPVLFDRHQRSRLVYRVEALPAAADALRLHPGQPVDVSADGA